MEIEAPPPSEDPQTSEPTPSLPSLADGVWRALDPRSVTVARLGAGIRAAIVALVLFVPLGIVLLAAPLGGGMMLALVGSWLTLAVLLGLRAFLWPAKAYRFASYKLDAEGLEIRRGVYFRRVIHVPHTRVQHTDVSQGPIERAYGLGTLVVYTAGTSYARVDLHGLAHETAMALRDLLLPREGDDAV